MKQAVRADGEAGIAHDFCANLRLEKGSVVLERMPGVTVGAEHEMEAVFAIAAKGSEQEVILSPARLPGEKNQDNGKPGGGEDVSAGWGFREPTGLNATMASSPFLFKINTVVQMIPAHSVT